MDKIPEISVTQTFSFFELFKGTLYIILSKRTLRTFLFFLGLVTFMQVTLGFLAQGGKGFDVTSIVATFVSILILLVLVFVFMFLVFLFIYNSRKAYYVNALYSFYDFRVTINASGKEFSKSWKEFVNVKESKHHFYLYLSKLEAYIVQKDKLIEIGELENLRKLVYKKTN